MGDISTLDRCHRFIDAFNDLARRDYGPEGDTAKSIFSSQSLGFDNYYDVRMFWNYKDEKQDLEMMLYEGPVFYNPEWGDDEIVDTVAEAFYNGGTDADEIIRRLKKADLISATYPETPGGRLAPRGLANQEPTK